MSLRLLHYSDVENAYDDPERLGRLAGLIDARRDDDTLVFGTGDNTSPGVLPLVTRGGQAIEFFDAISPDADTFGNHDFDYGPDRAIEIIEASPQPWLSANVERGGETFGAPAVKRWETFDVNGTTIGAFGLTTPRTGSINPNTGNVEFTDPIAAAEEAVDALRAAGADYVVALSHLGRGDEELARETDVDVILGGHIHAEVVEHIDGTLLTRPGVNGEILLEIELPAKAATRHVVREGPLDEGVAARVRAQKREAGVHEVVAHVEQPIERTVETCFRGESRVGNFVADAYLWATGADVALQNSGGIREGHALEDDVTIGDLISLIPFDEPLAIARVEGARLREAFAQGGDELGFGEPGWWHAHIAGASLEYDRRTGTLSNVTVQGDPIDDERRYTLAVSDYVLHSSDEFPALTEADRLELGDTQYEVLAAYAREHGIDPRIEGRVVLR
ncbi:bifunctional metallophosphatase/5'-nucleotidase [Natronomonas sp. EA1]|uniref:bifunctional metallophosphatase/5'-nucleotidase n=1 Tax=Natronomonas sp. EA1 TaxID=3421655 RepID=UPI003EBFFEDA